MSTNENTRSEGAYGVDVIRAGLATIHESGLSHASAMMVAEEIQSDGGLARVMHNTSTGRYEVDRYPLR